MSPENIVHHVNESSAAAGARVREEKSMVSEQQGKRTNEACFRQFRCSKRPLLSSPILAEPANGGNFRL